MSNRGAELQSLSKMIPCPYANQGEVADTDWLVLRASVLTRYFMVHGSDRNVLYMGSPNRSGQAKRFGYRHSHYVTLHCTANHSQFSSCHLQNAGSSSLLAWFRKVNCTLQKVL